MAQDFMKGIAPAAAIVLTSGLAGADTIFDTGVPDPGFLGYYGFDLSVDQSVAVAFTPDQDYRLDQVGLWIMSNDFASAGAPYTVSIRTDAQGGQSVPGDTVLESWDVETSAIGWDPLLETVDSVLNPLLSAGTTYWVVAESDSQAFVNAVWVASAQDQPVWSSVQNVFNPGGDWISGDTQGAPGLTVSGTVVPGPGVASLLCMIGMSAGVRRRR
ncbi:MAG: choice-of-anchor R domain-containing protein [Planctomycetota bacterium]